MTIVCTAIVLFMMLQLKFDNAYESVRHYKHKPFSSLMHNSLPSWIVYLFILFIYYFHPYVGR